MRTYVLGFIFTPDFSKVLLIHKNRPEYQKGKLNGLGGKIEQGETEIQAMVREIREESGLQILEKEWKRIGEMNGKDWNVTVFACHYTGKPTDALDATDETVEWIEVQNLPKNVMENLPWLIPLSINVLQHMNIVNSSITYII
jgi:8-oxo-dGTP diphosphatase